MDKSQLKKTSLLKNLFKLHWMLLAIFIYSGTIAVGNFFIIKPQLIRYNDLKEQKENLDNIYLKIRSTDIEQVLINLDTELNICQSLKSSFESRIANEKDFSALLGELNYIVKKSDLRLNSIAPMKKGGEIFGKYYKQPINIKFRGSYSRFLSFLNNIEKSHYWLLIDSFSISPDSRDSANYNFDIVIFSIVI
jgi:Tfp pilus assembly protein PilO